MTELDETVLVAKMAYALRDCQDLFEGDRKWFYLSRVGIDLSDFIPGLRERLDRRAIASENHRRRLNISLYVPADAPQ
jgi:hypothetical protein